MGCPAADDLRGTLEPDRPERSPEGTLPKHNACGISDEYSTHLA